MAMLKPEKRIAAFEEMAFGMFIHFGLYSLLGKGEWIQSLGGMSLEDYMPLKEKFVADKFDPKAIVKLAKATGMKYITLTTRHHEGFSLYDAKGLDDYDVLHSPAGKDLVREFVDACNEEGIVPFFYHTTLDWYREEFEGNFDAYLEYLRQSVEVLCTEYGKIGGFWFDGNWSKPDSDWKLDDLYGTIRKHQPDAMIINNTGLDEQGTLGHPEIDSVTFEQGIPHPIDRTNMSKYITGEMCYTLNDHWGCGSFDFNYKSPADLIKALCHCRKAGANLLLNIGPNGDGSIEEMTNALLRILGRWMDTYGESIYEGRPCEVEGVGENFCLANAEGKHYLFVFDLPIVGDSNVTVSKKPCPPTTFTKIFKEVACIKWMDNDEKLSFIQDSNSGVLTMNTTGFKYGSNHVVRVAELTFK
ncbi:MAG: alpha-L-fucosidase [Cellulosilyticaceae bacterium]